MTPYNFRRIVGWGFLGLLALLLLVGCASPFDHNEHSTLTTINQVASEPKTVCGDLNLARSVAEDMATQSQWIYIYSSNLDGNVDMTKMAKNLMDITKEFQSRFNQPVPPSRTYCIAKVENIKQATDVMLKISGRRAR